MDTQNSSRIRSGGVTRRRLLASAAAAGAVSTLGGSVVFPGFAQAADDEIISACHWGVFHAKVENGRFAAIMPWDKDPHPTPMLAGVQDSVYSPTRIRYPMVRKAYLDKGPAGSADSRGSGDFVRVSWNQALDLVAKEVKRVRDANGPTSLFAGSYGWMSTGKLHNCQTLLRRAMNLTGGFVNSSGDYSTGASQIIMPHVVGSLEVYEQQTAWPVVVDHTDLLVLWGADLTNNNQIGWLVPEHGVWEYYDALKKSGKKIIAINPLQTASAKDIGAEWIAPRPQTDVAMMLGIAHTLVTEKLHDEKFLATYTTGFDQFQSYLMGEKDSTPKTAEWASAICGVDAAVIKDLAHRFTKGTTMLASGWGVQRQHHGEQVHWMLVTLACMLGQIGTPGGGFGLSYHYSGGGTPTADAPALSGIDDGSALVKNQPWLSTSGAATIPCARVSDMLLNPGKQYDFNGAKATYPDIKLVYWVGGDPFVHHQQRNKMVEAFKRVETFIVHDFQWTPTARHADIVLPATSPYERNDIEQVGDYSQIAIVAMKKIIDPVFEARSDYDIFADIADRLGKKKDFTNDMTEMQWLQKFYADAKKQADDRKIDMPDFDTFWNQQGIVEFSVPDSAKAFVRYSAFREDPLTNALGTPSGLIEIYSKTIEKMNYDDCPPHPTWMEPFERLGGPNAKYPLHVTTQHPPKRLHSQLAGTKLRAEYAIAGREPCMINPADAKTRGLADGDVVRVFNDRGQILAGVQINEDIMPGVVRISEGGWYDPQEQGKVGTLDKYGDVNGLSNDVGSSKLGQGNCGHSILAEVEKFKGDAPPVDVYDAPKGAV